MVTTTEISGEKCTVIVLGKALDVDINEYRKAIFNMFEMATLFPEFAMCIRDGEMNTILKFIKTLGLPEEKGGEE